MAGPEGQLADVLAQAVSVLHGTQDLEQRKSANEWLNGFAKTREAWNTSLDLVGVNNGHATEVQFFAANMLCNKVKNDFGDLVTEEERRGILGAIVAKLRSVLGAEDHLVKERLGLALVLGSVHCNSPDTVIGEATSCLSAGDPKCDSLSLVMLRTIAEEADTLGHTKRQTLAQLLHARTGALFKFLDDRVRVDRQRMAAVHAPLGKCVAAWAGLDSAVTLGSMAGAHGNLFNFLLCGVVDAGEQESEACAEAIAAVIVSSPHGDQQLYPQLTQYFLVENSGKVLASEKKVEAVARIGAALAVNHGSFFQWEQGLRLAEFFLEALKRAEERSAKERVLEFFMDLHAVPMEMRLPQLRKPLYEQLLLQLVEVASYPADFETWAECYMDDADSFHRFREQFLAELFESAFLVLGTDYYKVIMSLFARFQDKAAATAWQAAEAVIFSLRTVAVLVKASLNLSSKGQAQAATAEANDVHQMLKILFTHVSGGVKQIGVTKDVFLSHHVVVEGVARLIGSYAQWFGKNPHSPVEQALSYLLFGIQLNRPEFGPTLPTHASHSFKIICMKCGHRLKTREAVIGLINAISGCVSASSAALADKKALVEGVSRLITLLGLEDATFAVEQLLHPVLHRLHQTIASGNGQGDLQLKCDLELYASAVRFFEFPCPSPPAVHPTLHILQRSWDTFEAVLGNEESMKSEENAEALCSIFGHVISSAGPAVAEVLPAILSRTLALLQLGAHTGCLEVVANAVEAFSADERLTQHLRDAAHRSFEITFSFLRSVRVQDHAQHVEAVYDVASKCLIFRPDLVLEPGVLGSLFQMAVSTIVLKERGSVMAVNAFLSQLMQLSFAKRQPIWAAAQPAVMDCLNAHGKSLVGNVLLALAETCPAHLLRSLGSCLHHLRNLSGSIFDGWLIEIMTSADFRAYLAKCNPAFKAEDVDYFIHVVLRQPPLERSAFEAIVADYAGVCRGELNGDCLHAHK